MPSTVTESFFVADFSYSYSCRLLVLPASVRRWQRGGSKSTSRSRSRSTKRNAGAADGLRCGPPSPPASLSPISFTRTLTPYFYSLLPCVVGKGVGVKVRAGVGVGVGVRKGMRGPPTGCDARGPPDGGAQRGGPSAVTGFSYSYSYSYPLLLLPASVRRRQGGGSKSRSRSRSRSTKKNAGTTDGLRCPRPPGWRSAEGGTIRRHRFLLLVLVLLPLTFTPCFRASLAKGWE